MKRLGISGLNGVNVQKAVVTVQGLELEFAQEFEAVLAQGFKTKNAIYKAAAYGMLERKIAGIIVISKVVLALIVKDTAVEKIGKIIKIAQHLPWTLFQKTELVMFVSVNQQLQRLQLPFLQ